jgi:ABC-type taurine transport system substrate-binding protein
MEDGLTIRMDMDYKKMNTGLESLAGEFSFVGRVISDKEYYNQSSFATLNDYIKTLEKAVKEPEKAKAYINSFVLNSAKNKNAFSKKLVKKEYNKADQPGKIRILKAYTEKGVIDAGVMNTFGINEKEIDNMIYTSKLVVLGYNKYKLK